MNPKSIPFFALIKQTFSFIFKDLNRLWRLTAFPLLFLVFFAGAGMIPPYTLTEDATPKAILNYPMIIAFLFCLLVLYTLLMVKIHRVIFYGDDGKYYFPQFNRFEIKYLWNFFKILAVGMGISLLTLFGLYFLVQIFWPDNALSAIYVFWISVFCSPYFIIRLFAVLPASSVDDKISVKTAWKMTQGMGITLSMYYVITLIVPLIIGSVLSSFMLMIFQTPFLSEYLITYLSLSSLLFACVAQAAFMSYAYAVLREQYFQQKNIKESILSVAKTAKTD